MPGKKELHDSKSSWMAPFTLQRTITANDTITQVGIDAIAESVSFVNSTSATRNRIWVMPVQTAGSAGIQVDLYGQLGGSLGSIATNTWVLIESSGAYAASRDMLRFEDLFAGIYKIVVTLETPTDDFQIHVSSSENCGGD